ncbi:MAG: hypothetical protein ACOYXB_00675 [Bacteroidota bacterium]
MEINRTNYEAWFLDEMEGRLTPEKRSALQHFLLLNPDLEEEFRTLKPVKAIPENITYPDHEALKLNIPPHGTHLTRLNFDLFAIAWLEGDLDPEQRKAFEEQLGRSAWMKEQLELIKMTVLVPDQVKYSGKSELKKPVPQSRNIIWLSWLAAAAAVAAVLLVFALQDRAPEMVLADRDEVPQEKTEEQLAPEKKEQATTNHLNISIRHKEQPPDQNVPVGKIVTSQELPSVQDEEIRIESPQLLAGTIFATRDLPENRPESDRIRPIYIPPINSYTRNAPIQLVARKEFEELKMTLNKAEDLSIWDLASAGIQELNKVAGTDMSLMASRDEEGDLAGLSFSSRRFSLSTPLGRNKE